MQSMVNRGEGGSGLVVSGLASLVSLVASLSCWGTPAKLLFAPVVKYRDDLAAALRP